ncbi:TackOD1 domain-containing metal-binding protein [Aeromonas sanarellii]|uniref:TackOD1 domain-containing metal-binding protein n=1 Tax=Aeromonas sanarellii TaxID=633415 RepID=UPI0038D0B3B2
MTHGEHKMVSPSQHSTAVALLGEPVARPTHPQSDWSSWDPAAQPVLLLNLPADEQDSVLQALRRDPVRYLHPVFCTAQSPLSPMLADGLLPQLDERLPDILERLALLTPREHPDGMEKLAWYAWPRPHFRLLPRWQAGCKQGYHYPLLDCLLGSDAMDALPQLVAEHLLQSEQLVDRVRLCNGCLSSHLNFIDVCPECFHIAIQATPAVHCFTCGYVDDQDAFMVQGQLRCPKCVTTLRHIGVDYDRPLEKFRCLSCHARFMEAAVQARCLECGQAHKPDDLVVASIFDYRIGKLARHVAREGTQQLHLPLTWGTPMAMEHFPWLLQWKNSLLQRHGGQDTLLAIRIERLAELRAELGLLKTQQRLAVLLTRLQALFRNTDVVCQYADDLLLLLLPHTDEEGWHILVERIHALNGIEGLDALALTAQVHPLPTQLGEDASLWLSRWLEEHLHA